MQFIKRNAVIIAIIGLFIITVCSFYASVQIRKPWMGALSHHNHHWLTGSTIKYLKNWQQGGISDLKFTMIENPNSIEFETIKDRGVYLSYPNGTIFPLFIISKLLNKKVDPSLVMTYNLMNHFLITIGLVLICFVLLLSVDIPIIFSFLFATIPIFLELFLPGTLYFHQNVFFSDQAVILPIVLFLLLEVAKDTYKQKEVQKIFFYTQWAIMFWGISTDWFFMFVAAAIYIKRIIQQHYFSSWKIYFSKSIKYWSSIILALGLYGFQLVYWGYFKSIYNKFLFRTALNKEGQSFLRAFYQDFWQNHVKLAFGDIGIWLIWGSICAAIIIIFALFVCKIVNKKVPDQIEKIATIIGVVTLSCIVQIYCFMNHSINHNFSTLKFSLIISLIPFVLLPIFIFLICKPLIKNKKGITVLLATLFLSAAISSGYYVLHFKAARYVEFSEPRIAYEKIGDFLEKNTEYVDIVFSSEYEVKSNPPQQLSYSMKRVYKATTIFDIYEKVKDIDKEYVINIFHYRENPIFNYGFLDLVKAAYLVKNESDLQLYKIKKDVFLKTVQQLSMFSDRYKERLIETIKKSQNPFLLYEMYKDYQFLKEKEPKVSTYLNRLFLHKMEFLINKQIGFSSFHPNVTLYGFYIHKVMPELFKAYFIFYVEKKIDQRLKVAFLGYKETGPDQFEPVSWHFFPKSQSKYWEEGKYQIISTEFDAKEIPYFLRLGLYNENQSNQVILHDLGWFNFNGSIVKPIKRTSK